MGVHGAAFLASINSDLFDFAALPDNRYDQILVRIFWQSTNPNRSAVLRFGVIMMSFYLLVRCRRLIFGEV